MDPVGAIVAAVGLLCVSGMVHLVRNQTVNGQLGRNSAIGIRTKATQLSESAWSAGHRAAGPWLLATALTGYAGGLTALVLSLALLATDAQSPVALIIALAGYVAVVVLLVVSAGKANTACTRSYALIEPPHFPPRFRAPAKRYRR